MVIGMGSVLVMIVALHELEMNMKKRARNFLRRQVAQKVGLGVIGLKDQKLVLLVHLRKRCNR